MTKMFDTGDPEQDDLDFQLVEELTAALENALREADGWHDESRDGQCPGLDKERRILAGAKGKLDL